MNKEFNKALLNCLSDEGVNLYRQFMDNIQDDTNNIKFLLLYAVTEEDYNVISAVKDYISKTCNVKDINNINLDNMKTLIEIHSKYYEELIKHFYMLYSGLETSIITLKYCNDNDFETALQIMFKSLENLSNSTTYISDFMLNYCAIRYIYNKDISKSNDYISKHNLPRVGFLNNIIITSEFKIIFQKLNSMVLAYHNDNENGDSTSEISMYDTFGLAKKAIQDAINNRAIEIANFMERSNMSYETLNLFVLCASYYSAIWSVLLEQTKYKVSFDGVIPSLFRELAHELAQEDNLDSTIYYKLKEIYYDTKKQLETAKKEIASRKNFDKMYCWFKENVGYIEEINLYYFFQNTIEEIKKFIDS